MLFNLTTDKLSLITDETCDVDVVVTFIDRVISTGAIGAAARQLTTIATATTTDIMAVPAADTERKVEQITIRNAHATTSADVTVQFNANGTLYELFAARLYPTEMLEWNEHTGFKTITRKEPPVFQRRICESGPGFSSSVVSGSLTNVVCLRGSSVNIPRKTGGVTRVVASMYLWHDLAAATTTGVALGHLTPNPGFSASNNQNIQVCVDSVTAATLSAHDAGAADSLIANGTSGVTNMMGIGGGSVKWAEADPPVTLDFNSFLGCQSEVGASLVTIDTGAWFELFEATG